VTIAKLRSETLQDEAGQPPPAEVIARLTAKEDLATVDQIVSRIYFAYWISLVERSKAISKI